MDSRGVVASPKEHGVGSKKHQKRPLHVCAVSFIAIGHRIYTKAHDLNGPIGTTLERISALASPVVWIAQYIFLAAISFLDDCILASEGIFGFLFPPSNYVFDTIEDLVRITETLPKKFDVLMNKFPTKLHDLVPFLDWVLAHFIARLNFVVYNLATWGLENTMKKEIIAFQPDIGNRSDTKKCRVNPNSENRSSEEGEVVGLTIKPLNTKLSHEDKHIIQPDSKNGPRSEDVAAARTVSEKAKMSPEDHHIIQSETRNGPRNKDVAAQPVSENSSREQRHIIQQDTKNRPHSEDVMAQTISENKSSHEEYVKVESKGRAGLAIEPIDTNQSSEEENTVCFTVQPSEEDPAVGMMVKPASVGSNIIGLAIQPISKKGSYKEVLERGLTPNKKCHKDVIQHTTRIAARGQYGKKNTSNFRRSASYT